jgi:hypothetical protein
MSKKQIKRIQKTTPENEILTDLGDHYFQRFNENKSSRLKMFQDEIESLDRIVNLYFLLSGIIIKSKTDLIPARFLVCKSYLKIVTNNFFAIKKLFISGLDIQFQIMVRTQLEYLNNLLALIGDDDFFQCYVLNKGKDDLNCITPKPINAEKSIKKILKKFYGIDYEKYFSQFVTNLNSTYKDLSESAHGNILRTLILSYGADVKRKNILKESNCGTIVPLPVFIDTLRHSINNFQVFYLLIWENLEERELLDKRNQLFDFLLKLRQQIKFYIDNKTLR